MMTDRRWSWWRNCTDPPDATMRAIDAAIDDASLTEGALRVRRLIGSLEMCHHKAERWVELVIDGIADGYTRKGMGTRPVGSRHPVEDVWQSACDALTGWCEGSPRDHASSDVGRISASQLFGLLGEQTPLKVWQVEQLVAKVRLDLVPTETYRQMVEGGSLGGRPEEYRQATLASTIHDTVDGLPAEISLAAAIDHLEPCHWGFVQNLQTVVAAIGGDLYPERPYGSCGRNITLAPIRGSICDTCDALVAYCAGRDGDSDREREMVRKLGEATPVKRWLAASLAATIQSQLRLEHVA